MAKIAIILVKDKNINKYIMSLKRVTGLGLNDIRNRIEMANPIIECKLFKNEDDTSKIKEIVNIIVENHIESRILMQKTMENDLNEVSIEYLTNRINSYEDGFKRMWDEGIPD